MTMLNFFNRALCSLLTAGFIFGDCNYLNKYDDLPKTTKPSIVKSERQTQEAPVKNYYSIMAKSPIGIDKSNFYMNKDFSLREYTMPDCERISFPKSNYITNDKQINTKSQAREKILEYFGLDGLLMLNKINLYDDRVFDAKIRLNFLDFKDLSNSSFDIRESQLLWFLEALEFTVRFRF